jgi:hypothetical protein
MVGPMAIMHSFPASIVAGGRSFGGRAGGRSVKAVRTP